MSPARATLLHSPGWNEGKARYETLGTHETKSYMSSVGAALQRAHLLRVVVGAVRVVPPLRGSINISITTNPRACALGFEKVSPRWGSSTPQSICFI